MGTQSCPTPKVVAFNAALGAFCATISKCVQTVLMDSC